MSSKEGPGHWMEGFKTDTRLSPSFLMETKFKEIHQHPDTIMSPLTMIHRLGPTQGLPRRNHLVPQPAVGSGTTLAQKNKGLL